MRVLADPGAGVWDLPDPHVQAYVCGALQCVRCGWCQRLPLLVLLRKAIGSNGESLFETQAVTGRRNATLGAGCMCTVVRFQGSVRSSSALVIASNLCVCQT